MKLFIVLAVSICCIVFQQQMQQLEAFTVASKEAEENLVVITEEELSKTVNSVLPFYYIF